MNNVLVCHSGKKSSWTSCNIITSNLLGAYSEAGFIIGPASEENLASVDTIVFVENSWMILPVLNGLISKNKTLPKIIIHTFGDFISHAMEWHSFLKLAVSKNIEIKLIAPSEAEADKLKFLVGQANVEVAFFPITSTDTFDSDIRNLKRKELNIADDVCVLLYSGRISLQKNVDKLIYYFDSLKKSQPDRKFKLLVAGSYDNLGTIFPEGKIAEGYLFHKIQKALNVVDSQDIHFLGELSHEEVMALNHAADAYISLSLYHSEDFGLAPVEALRAGLPCLLTRWGGFKSLERIALESIYYADVEIENFGFQIHTVGLNSFKIHDPDQRVATGKSVMAKFGYSAFIEVMNRILAESYSPSKFELSNLRKYSDIFLTETSNPAASKDSLILKNNFYEQVFRSFTDPVTGNADSIKFSWYQDFEACKPFLRSKSTIPFSFPYFGVHNPYFYNFSPESGSICLRDGAVPENLPDRFILAAGISEHYANRKCYEIKSKRNRGECDSLCLVVDSAFLSDFTDKFDFKFKNIEIYVFGDLNGVKLPEVNSSDIRVQSIEAFFLRKNFKSYFYYEIINKNRIADSFTRHFALARGAVEWSSAEHSDLVKYEEKDLSPNHKIVFYQGRNDAT